MKQSSRCVLLRPTGEIRLLPTDPGTDIYHDPPTVPETSAGVPFHRLDAIPEYRRFQLMDGSHVVGHVFAISAPSVADRSECMRILSGAI